MNPENHDPKLSSEEHKEIIKRMIKTGVNKIIPYLINNYAFIFNEKKVIETPLPTHISSKPNEDNLTKKPRKSIQEKPCIIFSDEYRKRVYGAFTKLYPLITYEFEKSSDKRYSYNEALRNTPSLVNYYKEKYHEQSKAYKAKIEKQKLCKHKYKEPQKTDTGRIIQQCSICNFIKFQNKKHLSR